MRLIHEWPLAPSATLGSSVRAKGIRLEIRARLPSAVKKLINVEASALVLRVPEDDDDNHEVVAATISRVLDGIDELPVIPREAEDILSITTVERHRWLKDGRLRSAGTRTVKLRGRARKITFHVFDPRHIEDVLDRNLPEVWREEDAAAAAENRRRAAGKAALTRTGKNAKKAASGLGSSSTAALETKLKGWEEFDLDGLLR